MRAFFMLQGRDIICFSTADWDTPLPTNKHQVMTRLARSNRVVFVEALGTRRVQWASGADLGRIWRRLGRFLGGLRRVPPAQWPVGGDFKHSPSAAAAAASSSSRGSGGGAAGLWVLSPAVLPRWELAPVAALNRLVLSRQLRGAMRKLRMSHPIAWCYSPHAIHVLSALRPSCVLYHMVDDLSAVPGAESRALRRAEAALLRRAEVAVCTEEKLRRRAARFHPSPALMENVADFEHFQNGDPGRLSAAGAAALRRIRAMPAPRLVFSGHLAPHKVDFDLLEAIVRERPEGSLILIGPVWEGAAPPPALERLRRSQRVFFSGKADYANLPALLHAADVLLIPYVLNDATRHVSPLKFFEYLATGRPIVATPLPSLLRYGEIATLAGDARGFIEGIEKSISAGDEKRALRLELARRSTWDQRIEDISRLIEESEKNFTTKKTKDTK